MSTRSPTTDSLRQWILSTANAGHGFAQIIQMMLRAGYNLQQAQQIVAKTLDRPAVALDLHVQCHGSRQTRHPEPASKWFQSHRVEVSLCVEKPSIRVLEQLLDDQECEYLIAQARPRLARSRTVNKNGSNKIDKARTSSGMFFKVGETPVIERIEQRIAEMIDLPVVHGEGLQILHYLPGQQYEPHFDWFDPSQDGFTTLTAKSGQRVATLIMYLNSPTRGGGTHFPKAGVTVSARRGTAVYFAYQGGEKDSLHAGLPVTEGEKWIATKWLRELPFR